METKQIRWLAACFPPPPDSGLGWGAGVAWGCYTIPQQLSRAGSSRQISRDLFPMGLGGGGEGKEVGYMRWISSSSSSSSASLGLTDFSQVDMRSGQIHQSIWSGKEPGLTKLVIPSSLRQRWKRGRELTAPWRSRRIWEDGGFRDAGPQADGAC